MNDCIWFRIGVCNGHCKCDNYISINGEEGVRMCGEYEDLVHEKLEPLAHWFAEKYGYNSCGRSRGVTP